VAAVEIEVRTVSANRLVTVLTKEFQHLTAMGLANPLHGEGLEGNRRCLKARETVREGDRDRDRQRGHLTRKDPSLMFLHGSGLVNEVITRFAQCYETVHTIFGRWRAAVTILTDFDLSTLS
jgi:hypothetical protein